MIQGPLKPVALGLAVPKYDQDRAIPECTLEGETGCPMSHVKSSKAVLSTEYHGTHYDVDWLLGIWRFPRFLECSRSKVLDQFSTNPNSSIVGVNTHNL